MLIAGTGVGEIVLWQFDKRAPQWRKKVFEKGGAVELRVSLDGKYIFAIGNDGQLKVVKTADGEVVVVEPIGAIVLLAALKAPLVGVVTGERGTKLAWLSYRAGDSFEFGDRGEASGTKVFISYNGALSWDGKRAAMGNSYSDGKSVNKHTLDVFDTDTGNIIVSIPRDEEFKSLDFSPDGSKIVFWGGPRDQKLYLLDLAKKEIIRTLDNDLDYVSSNRFSSDGKYVYTLAGLLRIEAGKPATYIRVYEVETGKFRSVIAPAVLPTTLQGRVGVNDLDISGDGKRFVISLLDSTYPNEIQGNLPDYVVWDMP